MPAISEWQIQPAVTPPTDFVQWVRQYLPESDGQYAAQLLWQRGIQNREQLVCFIDPQYYQPTSPFAFGQEMEWAVERLSRAYHTSEKVAIWGDFDADGVTATAVLWDGLGEFFPQHERLCYFIPNRLSDSHGLSLAGLQQLAQQGYSLVVTCDTGSTNLSEIQLARSLGIDLIITDHHLLLQDRPSVVALINPHSLPSQHPLFHLSGVAVAYKLMEALYETLPDVPQRPLSNLLDLVAIGLIADLVQLTGDCRYLAQQGILALQRNQDPITPPRPGIAKLLELCRRSGDRPTDVSFGLGPRINAISRIQGDAQFCVELLTSSDRDRCHQLALETELANARRKVLQRDMLQQAKQKLAQIDLSTTPVIILTDPQWSIGLLGLVAGQIAQEYGRPTILFSTESEAAVSGSSPPMARGSARSVNQIDLYDLLSQQSQWLQSFGGHPLAVGLCLPVANIPAFTQSINQAARVKHGEIPPPTLQADLTVPVADLGKPLFQELKLLEPYGIGNPVPKLLIRDCWFSKPWHRKTQDLTGRKLAYIKTEFVICDDSCPGGFPGVWWGHYKDELPLGRCDVIVELDFNSYEDAGRKKRYEVRLVAVRASSPVTSVPALLDWLLDWRVLSDQPPSQQATEPVLQLTSCPASWDELAVWLRQAQQTRQKLALAYGAPSLHPPNVLWQQFVSMAQSLSKTRAPVDRRWLQQELGLGNQSFQVGCQALEQLEFVITVAEQHFQIRWAGSAEAIRNLEVNHLDNPALSAVLEHFFQTVQEEQFRQQYFYQAPLATIQTVAEQMLGGR
jgi:single-stranded-DNA-specific exonuclease